MNLPDERAIEKRHAAVRASRTFRNVRNTFTLQGKRVLDVGCGYGEYLALFGVGSLGITTTAHEVVYGKRAGLDIRQGNAEALDELHVGNLFNAVWANNLYEHLLSPHSFLMRLKHVVKDDGIIILGVPVVPRVTSLLSLRKFRGALASNHINFFTKETLSLTAQRAGWIVEEVRPFFFANRFLDSLIAPLAPHLYLVARNNPYFQYPPKKIKEWADDPRYVGLLSIGTRKNN